MMVLDASAALAMLLEESDSTLYFQALKLRGGALLSPVNYLEIAMTLETRRGSEIAQRLDAWLERLQIILMPITPGQAHYARAAFLRYGKGRHPARLNMGDCFAYALAMEQGAELLFKGEDFRKTDVRAAVG